jgi:hypothetical protein
MTFQGSQLVNRTPLYLGWLCAAALVHQPAHAEEELTEASTRVFREAIAAVGKKQWADCRTKAIGVWQQVKSPKVAGILGICEAELGMHRDAAEHLDFFFVNQKGAAQAQVDQAKTRFDAVRPKVALVEITPTPEDAMVLLKGLPVGPGKQRLWVDPGEVVVALSKDGETKTQTVQVIAGETRTLSIELPKKADPGTGGAGAAGSGAGGAGAGGSGAGGSGGGGPLPIEEPTPIWPAILLGSVGGAALLVGGGLTIGRFVARSDAEDLAQCEPFTQACSTASQDKLDEADTLQNAGFAMVGIGAASLVAMGVFLAVRGSEPPVVVVPQVESGGLGLVVAGEF